MSRKHQLLTLAAEIEDESRKLTRLVQEVEQTWKRVMTVPPEDQSYFLESEALKLHNSYTGCERIFEKIAAEINGGRPQTHDWHIRLLHSMTLEVPDVRPPVLSASLEKELMEYLKFRHLVGNIYGFELDPARMRLLIENIGGMTTRFAAEIERFVQYLRELAGGLVDDY